MFHQTASAAVLLRYHIILGNKEVKRSNGCSTHRSAQVDQIRTQYSIGT